MHLAESSPPFGSTPERDNAKERENKMNKGKTVMIALALAIVATALGGLLATSVGEPVVRLVGKAAWYLPYAALVGLARTLKLA